MPSEWFCFPYAVPWMVPVTDYTAFLCDIWRFFGLSLFKEMCNTRMHGLNLLASFKYRACPRFKHSTTFELLPNMVPVASDNKKNKKNIVKLRVCWTLTLKTSTINQQHSFFSLMFTSPVQSQYSNVCLRPPSLLHHRSLMRWK